MVNNLGLASEDFVDLRSNPLCSISLSTHIPTLQDRGVIVYWDPPDLVIYTTVLPGGQVGLAYEAVLEAAGGTEPYTWAVFPGVLPDELMLAAETGVISGTPTEDGTFDFIVKVTDAEESTATRELSITIATKQVSTIDVTSAPEGASFSITGSVAYTGTAPWSVTDATMGEYTISCDDLSGYTKPTTPSQQLADGETITFEGVYAEIPQVGTINVGSLPTGAAFSITGPANYSGTAPWSTETAPVGTYTIIWDDLAGYTNPADDTQVLADGGIIDFHGVYAELDEDDLMEKMTLMEKSAAVMPQQMLMCPPVPW